MKVLSLQERIDFVDGVAEKCQVGDEYQPALFDVMFRLYVLKYFGNVDFVDYPQQDWPSIVFEEKSNFEAETLQIEGLRAACTEKIERNHREFLTLATISKRDALSEFVDNLGKYLDDFKKNVGDVDVQKLMDVANELNNVDSKAIAAKIVGELQEVQPQTSAAEAEAEAEAEATPQMKE